MPLSDDSATPPEQYSIGDCLAYFNALRARGVDFLVVGGQAVMLWARFFREACPELQQFVPFTSRDLDVRIPISILIRANESNEFDSLFSVSSLVSDEALAGTLGPASIVPGEILKRVPGLLDDQLEESRCEVPLDGVPIPVIAPPYLLEAKLWNLLNIPLAPGFVRMDDKHIEILALLMDQALKEARSHTLAPENWAARLARSFAAPAMAVAEAKLGRPLVNIMGGDRSRLPRWTPRIYVSSYLLPKEAEQIKVKLENRFPGAEMRLLSRAESEDFAVIVDDIRYPSPLQSEVEDLILGDLQPLFKRMSE